MNLPHMRLETPWNTEFMLPRVTDNAQLLELQILLGGLQLVLSRVHPAFAATRFTATRQLAARITRGIEYQDAHKAHMGSADLQRSLNETERALDPGSLMVLRKLLTQTLKEEQEQADGGHAEFTYSDFIAEERLAGQQLAAH
ncbi:hypothetical protein J2X19_003687 [Rhodoferax ferrireducens]|uniref:Uncharacterized protein n=1 Tax=Rhodoferax ferrireducens TaxID=192843 RepID=A0ABU2CCD7_9BURK|nr:hypothetical protein [Rhodoferax ferrireducens]MDR7378993.1 hypothetical protein [Rhodoferax ferrireducens]